MLQFFTVILIAVYIGGVWKFLAGFDKTNFENKRFQLALLWPILLSNRSYRQNFNRALKG